MPFVHADRASHIRWIYYYLFKIVFFDQYLKIKVIAFPGILVFYPVLVFDCRAYYCAADLVRTLLRIRVTPQVKEIQRHCLPRGPADLYGRGRSGLSGVP